MTAIKVDGTIIGYTRRGVRGWGYSRNVNGLFWPRHSNEHEARKAAIAVHEAAQKDHKE